MISAAMKMTVMRIYACLKTVLTVVLEGDNWSLTVGSNHSHVYYNLPISIGQYSASITDCISIMS